MFPDNNRYKSDHVILDKESHEHQLKDFSFTFLELPKFHKELSDSRTMTEKWMYFFKHADEMSEADLEKLVGTNVVLRHAYEELDKFSWSEEELMFYEEALKSQLDYQAMLDSAKNEGREEGIQQGIEQGREEGIELGIERGIERGIEQEREEGRQAQCRLLTNLLRTKFKEIPESHFQSIETADVSQLETWILRLMTAHSMEDVFHE
jgi:predicted transposase/invertase (TIGR01784 family)